MSERPPSFSAFLGHDLVARGDLRTVLTALAHRPGGEAPVLILDDLTGDRIEPDPRHDLETNIARLTSSAGDAAPRTGRGRPRLGVTAREVTLLPRHWDWLAAQPGGASAALRRLVDAARREGSAEDVARRSHRALDRFLYLVAGDLPLFEDAYRAFYADDAAGFRQAMEAWPSSVRDHALALFETARTDRAKAALGG
ncbi:DUF2239 family protein [Phenylobacterium montanum]|uniref:DUF2239 family protein n=1 Tax=Phenylobacterium montanum TaxID=2823693 RepID=A0A975G1Z4_9CAUL|nr:DUF2239 family protein [Caulobacter sp. S6]QUD89078.1 DUF2239 family protein [Caulobacter sp. S6]